MAGDTVEREIEVKATPRVEQTLARAREIAREKGHSYIGTEHLLLALIEDPFGVAGGVLNREADGAALTRVIEEILASPGYNTPGSNLVRESRTPAGDVIREYRTPTGELIRRERRTPTGDFLTEGGKQA